jgi:integrase
LSSQPGQAGAAEKLAHARRLDDPDEHGGGAGAVSQHGWTGAGWPAEWAERYQDHDLVFARVNGHRCGRDWVSDRSHELTEQAGPKRVRLQDLRHLAATLMLTAGVPLALASTALRHTT